MARRDAFIDHLQQVPLFAACSRKDLQLVARRAEDVRVPAGKTLVSEGETGHEFFVILDGEARVTRQGRKASHAPRAVPGKGTPHRSAGIVLPRLPPGADREPRHPE